MEHQDKTPPTHGPLHETALQEIARETRETTWWSWTVTGITAVVLLSAMYIVTIHHADEQAAARHPEGATQSQPAETPDILGGVPRPGGA